MSKIRVLPDHISNLIAAGEVVERPASVAKELVENAIDAGATRIVIDVESGGRRLLKIIDDGEGMTHDDAVLGFERHATSKISKAEDLCAIGTLGFRGEALASIASVAKVELVSNTAAAAAGTRVVIEGGRMRDVKDAAHPRGTTIAVRDLFFNTPARRKFLRSEATESYHLTNLATHYALAHPEIAFTLTNNGRETLRVAPAQDLRERAYQVFGAQFLDGLLEVDNRTADAAVADAVREAVRAGLASAGYAPTTEIRDAATAVIKTESGINPDENNNPSLAADRLASETSRMDSALRPQAQQERIGFGFATAPQREPTIENGAQVSPSPPRLST